MARPPENGSRSSGGNLRKNTHTPHPTPAIATTIINDRMWNLGRHIAVGPRDSIEAGSIRGGRAPPVGRDQDRTIASKTAATAP